MTTETTKHTPTKWKYNDVSGEIEDADGHLIARVYGNGFFGAEKLEAIDRRGGLIVEAVNSFDSLREENKRLKDALEASTRALEIITKTFPAPTALAVIKQARAALGGE